MSFLRTLRRSGPQLTRRSSPLTIDPCNRSLLLSQARSIHISTIRRDSSFTNILADDNPPAVQVKSITSDGLQLQDGLMIPSACIFLEGKVFLWDVPNTLWTGWGKEHFEVFETVVPKPEILLLGTQPGVRLGQP
ncbi:hypothetical protein D9615_000760 [Tricholomella constricta]|uniref:Uncharacterized protein n=1 Tax=Tricholomella constricta TaxID=117010 RepID=A0A8H5HRD8_9AGAR|nr:hypothetical protein D9615_000760 [Tricholomella constricta]